MINVFIQYTELKKLKKSNKLKELNIIHINYI